MSTLCVSTVLIDMAGSEQLMLDTVHRHMMINNY